MKSILSDNQGFTLIEIIIVTALVGIITSSIYAAYFDSTRVWFFNKERIEVQQTQDLVQSWFANNLRKAKKITLDKDYLGISNKDYIKIETKDNILEFYIDSSNNLFTVRTNAGLARNISDLKFDSFIINKENGLIKLTADVFNQKETKKYKFNSVYYPRLLNN